MIPSSRHYFLDRDQLAVGDCLVRHVDAVFGPEWLYFSTPARILATDVAGEVPALLETVERVTTEGDCAVGFVSYEAASAFDPKLPKPRQHRLPLAWFAIFDHSPQAFRELLPIYESVETPILVGEWDIQDYQLRFEKVHEALGQGGIYQANLTSRVEFEPTESIFSLFRRVCGTQPPPYATYLHGGDWQVASFSPELFLKRLGERIVMSPMKGTRSVAPSDLPNMTTDPKSMAENLMIVDMVRNDLGKIATVGSVQVPQLFEIESHRTVKQMTSRVEAITRAGLSELFAATFPPASVTGAPKLAACSLISQLESSSRELYCGAMGMVEPGGDAQFSVAIRTAWKSETDERVHYGIGSGLVWDSILKEEFEECALKATILVQPAPQWELIECFHRDALSYPLLLEDHWQRLNRSAIALGVPSTRKQFEELLQPLQDSHESLPTKVRVAVRRNGDHSVSLSESLIGPGRLKATVGLKTVGSRDPNLAHKTNSRQVFDDALNSAVGFDEVMLVNEQNEVVEFCRGNAIFRFGDQYVTPDTSSGCLPGIGARRLVTAGKAAYGTIQLERAVEADEIWFINSIRGLVEVELTARVPNTTAR